MKKNLGVNPYLFPMPVLMIATYNEDDSINVMNAAWGNALTESIVVVSLDENHKTSQNIKKRGAFTISIADTDHIEAADFFGIATGNKMPDKFAKSGLNATKSDKVDAPVVEEFPVTLECKVAGIQNDEFGFRVYGEIVNVLADEKVLDEKGKVDPTKLNAFVFDSFQHGYYKVGEKVGQAWKIGAGLMK